MYNAYAVPATISSSNSFDFISAYLAVAYSSTDDPSEVQIEGFLGSARKYMTRVSVTEYSPTFATLNFRGIDRLVFTSLENPHDQRTSQFVMDNLTFAWSVPPTPPEAPTDLTATAISSNQIYLSRIDNSDNETGFEIERYIEGTDIIQIVTVGANATNVVGYSDTGLQASTTYSYQVLAKNGSLFSDYSNIATATTLAAPVGTVAAPTFSPGGGTYSAPQTVTISCATEDATIHYTTNGSTPTESDPVVASGGTVLVDHSLFLKAIAWKSGLTTSNIRIAIYTITGGNEGGGGNEDGN